MKRFVFFATVVSVFLSVAAVVVSAQEAQISGSADLYVVQEGDTLYVLEGNYSGQPTQWRRIVEKNPFLQEPGRIWTDDKGRTIALIRPGEQLRGLAELGIIPKLYPIDQLRVAAPVQVEEPVAAKPVIPWWIWVIIVLTLLDIALVAYAFLRLTRNPVTAGQPMVAGGVNDSNVANVFYNHAAPYAFRPDYTQVKHVEKGKMYGLASIRYGKGKPQHLVLIGHDGYRALVRRDNGPWIQEFMLKECGNDIKAGARFIPGLRFRFVPDGVVGERAEAATDTTIQAPTATETTAQEQQPEQAEQPMAEKPLPGNDSTIATKELPSPPEGEKVLIFRPAVGDRPYLIETKGFPSVEVRVGKDGRTNTIRFS